MAIERALKKNGDENKKWVDDVVLGKKKTLAKQPNSKIIFIFQLFI